MTILLSSKENFLTNLNKILDAAKEDESSAITILTNRKWHMEVFQKMLEHDKIGRVKIGATTIFTIKHMRIEFKPVDLYL